MDGDQVFPLAGQMAGALDRLMPLHLRLDPAGVVVAQGPTAARLLGPEMLGRPVQSRFEIKCPQGLVAPGRLASAVGQRLRLRLLDPAPDLRLRGVLVPLSDAGGGTGVAGFVLNLSFGIDLPRAVSLLQLTDADFAATDQAMELLYLTEANLAVTGELRGLAQRLDTARRQARDEAHTDTLTGLRNRRACDMVLARLCREGAAFGLMHMDLDFFKAVNDTLGHAAGDHVLAEVASVLRANARAQDCIARVGGDEFVLLLPGMAEPAPLAAMAARIIAQISRPIPYQDQTCNVSASIGYRVVKAAETTSPDAAMASVDAALYAAKHRGRCRAVEYVPGLEGKEAP